MVEMHSEGPHIRKADGFHKREVLYRHNLYTKTKNVKKKKYNLKKSPFYYTMYLIILLDLFYKPNLNIGDIYTLK